MHRKDFKFFWIFEELFVFVIDSPVYSPPGSQDSPVYSPPWSHDSPVYSQPWSRDPRWWVHWGVDLHKLGTKKAAVTKNIKESRLTCDGLFVNRKFLVNLFWYLFQTHPRNRLPIVFIPGDWDSQVYSPQGSRDSIAGSCICYIRLPQSQKTMHIC